MPAVQFGIVRVGASLACCRQEARLVARLAASFLSAKMRGLACHWHATVDILRVLTCHWHAMVDILRGLACHWHAMVDI